MQTPAIANEAEARAFLASLAASPPQLRQKSIRLAREGLELAQMYYEQKGNQQGVERLQRCLDILQAGSEA